MSDYIAARPNSFVRDPYLQNREYLLYNSNPPEKEFKLYFDDEEFDDEFE